MKRIGRRSRTVSSPRRELLTRLERLQLRDRLVALASDYSPRAARVDLTLLRRDAHDAIDSELRRHKAGLEYTGPSS